MLVSYGPHLCTGFVVSASQGQVLTARHCVDESETILVDEVPATILKVDGLFALLSIVPMSKPPLDLRKDKVSV